MARRKVKKPVSIVPEIESLVERLDEHDNVIERMDQDIKEMKAELMNCAKKSDIESLRADFSKGLNVVLRDALRSVPHNSMVVITVVLALITVIGIFAPEFLKILH